MDTLWSLVREQFDAGEKSGVAVSGQLKRSFELFKAGFSPTEQNPPAGPNLKKNKHQESVHVTGSGKASMGSKQPTGAGEKPAKSPGVGSAEASFPAIAGSEKRARKKKGPFPKTGVVTTSVSEKDEDEVSEETTDDDGDENGENHNEDEIESKGEDEDEDDDNGDEDEDRDEDEDGGDEKDNDEDEDEASDAKDDEEDDDEDEH